MSDNTPNSMTTPTTAQAESPSEQATVAVGLSDPDTLDVSALFAKAESQAPQPVQQDAGTSDADIERQPPASDAIDADKKGDSDNADSDLDLVIDADGDGDPEAETSSDSSPESQQYWLDQAQSDILAAIDAGDKAVVEQKMGGIRKNVERYSDGYAAFNGFVQQLESSAESAATALDAIIKEVVALHGPDFLGKIASLAAQPARNDATPKPNQQPRQKANSFFDDDLDDDDDLDAAPAAPPANLAPDTVIDALKTTPEGKALLDAAEKLKAQERAKAATTSISAFVQQNIVDISSRLSARAPGRAFTTNEIVMAIEALPQIAKSRGVVGAVMAYYAEDIAKARATTPAEPIPPARSVAVAGDRARMPDPSEIDPSIIFGRRR